MERELKIRGSSFYIEKIRKFAKEQKDGVEGIAKTHYKLNVFNPPFYTYKTGLCNYPKILEYCERQEEFNQITVDDISSGHNVHLKQENIASGFGITDRHFWCRQQRG